MPKECAVCKQPAVVAARITRGDQIANVYLCENCTYRVGERYPVEIVGSAIQTLPKGKIITPAQRTQQQGTNNKNTLQHQENKKALSTKEQIKDSKSNNGWKIAFIAMLVIVILLPASIMFVKFILPNISETQGSYTSLSSDTQKQNDNVDSYYSDNTSNTADSLTLERQDSKTSSSESNENNMKMQYYNLGDTVATDIVELTLNSAEYTIALSNTIDENYFTPKNYDEIVDARNPFVASLGHTFVAFTYTINNLNRSSTKIYTGLGGNGSTKWFASVEYGGKKYADIEEGANYYYEDKQIMDYVNYPNGKLITKKANHWYNDLISDETLLLVGEKQSRRAYIDVPADLINSNEDIKITFAIPTSTGENKEFTYLISASAK